MKCYQPINGIKSQSACQGKPATSGVDMWGDSLVTIKTAVEQLKRICPSHMLRWPDGGPKTLGPVSPILAKITLQIWLHWSKHQMSV